MGTKSERGFNKRPFRSLAFWSFLILLFTAFPLMEYFSQSPEHAKEVLVMTFTKSGEFLAYARDWFRELMDRTIPSYYQGWRLYIPFSIILVPIFWLFLGWFFEMIHGMMDAGSSNKNHRRFR